MKAVVKKMDQLGRVHIPRDLRLSQGIETESEVELVPMYNGVLIRKASEEKPSE